MYYQLQVSKFSDFSELVYNKIVETVTMDVITYGLESNTLYYWRVKSINNLTGKQSDWSDVCDFITRPDDIIISQPTTGGGTNIIVFEAGSNMGTTCITPDGELGVGICVSGIGEDTLGEGLCGQGCSNIL
tara:strand:+ start:20639 stop:21031 length:393 start_codon:yes stop_codon:yes gene_type:complete